MPTLLDSREAGFGEALAGLLERRRTAEADVAPVVRAIIAEIREDGDDALLRLTARFDRLELTRDRLRIGEDEIGQAVAACSEEALAAIATAAARIRAFHALQLPESLRHVDAEGVAMGLRWTPIDAVGLYVPGGTAAYPSSVLMNAIPARVAGCRRLVMTVPTPDGRLDPLVLAAAREAEIDEIWRIGGAQAVAALAYGTAAIAPVDKIVGPGNAYVAEAKRQVFGRVGIDMMAGPSEVLVVAEAGADPAWIAADLLSQAEHDALAQALLVTTDRALAVAVANAVEAQLAELPRGEIAGASWRDHGGMLVVRDLEEAVEVVDRVAPEHLQLMLADPETFALRIRHAGAVFLGAHTPEVVGDYVGGPNHVLPTGGTARFASGLAVHDFLKRTTWLACDADNLRRLAPAALTLARAEGLEAHARAIEYRLAGRR